MEARKKLTKVQIDIMRSRSGGFFAPLLLQPKYVATEEIGVAGISEDTSKLLYNPKVVEKLDLASTKTLLMHEILHAALCHPLRMENRDHEKSNIAMDLEINSMLRKEGFSMPKKYALLFPENYKRFTIPKSVFGKEITINNLSRKTFEEIYKELPDIEENAKGHTGSDVVNHAFDSDTVDKPQQSVWKKALAQANASRGFESDKLRKITQEIFNPQIPWDRVLIKEVNHALSNIQSWKRPDRRSQSLGVYLPAYKREGSQVNIFVDTSGSIRDEQYSKFIAEIFAILNSKNVEGSVAYFTTHVYDEIDITHSNEILNYFDQIQSGGTSIESVNKHLKSKNTIPDTTIVFTDGYVEHIKKLIGKHIIIVVPENGRTDRTKHLGKNIQLN